MAILTEIFGDYPRVKILEVFAENDSDTLFITGIAKQTGLTKMTVNTHINKLIEEEIVQKTKKAGIIQYYQLNEKNPKVRVVLDIIKTIDSLNTKYIPSGFHSTLDDTQNLTISFSQTSTNNQEFENNSEENK